MSGVFVLEFARFRIARTLDFLHYFAEFNVVESVGNTEAAARKVGNEFAADFFHQNVVVFFIITVVVFTVPTFGAF